MDSLALSLSPSLALSLSRSLPLSLPHSHTHAPSLSVSLSVCLWGKGQQPGPACSGLLRGLGREQRHQRRVVPLLAAQTSQQRGDGKRPAPFNSDID